jgi:hypothetical protein
MACSATTTVFIQLLRNLLEDRVVVPFAFDLTPAIGWTHKALTMPAWVKSLQRCFAFMATT